MPDVYVVTYHKAVPYALDLRKAFVLTSNFKEPLSVNYQVTLSRHIQLVIDTYL